MTRSQIVAVGRMSSTMLEGIATGLSKLGHALDRHAGTVSTPELTSAEIIISGQGFAVSKSIIASAQRFSCPTSE